MMLALEPSLAMPIPKKEHHDIFETLVKVIAVAAACAVAPHLAPMIFPAAMAAGGTAAAIAAGVSAGLANAAIQGVAVAIGVEKRFSVNDVIESTFTAGAFQYAKAGFAASKAGGTAASSAASSGKQAATKLLSEGTARTMAMMRSAAGASVASQLVEMRLGTRDRFDFQQVISAAASQYVGAKISVPYEATPLGSIAKVAANTLADAAINSALYRQAPNFEQMAISAIGGQVGSYAGEMAGRWFDNHFTSAPASAPIATPQRNRAQAKPSDVPEHVRVAERSKVVEKKLSGSHVDATNSAWGKELSGHAQERMATRQTRWQAEIHKRANQTTSTQSVVSQRDSSHVDALNKYTSSATKKIISTLAAAGDSRIVAAINASGKTVGSILNPIVSAGESFYDSYVSAKQGNRSAAIGNAALGAVSLVPGVGPLTKVAAAKVFLKTKGIFAVKSATRVGAGGKLIGGTVLLKSDPLARALSVAKLTIGKPNQLEVILDDGSKVIFRRDIGEHAHPIGKNYPNPVDHYNIEIHTPHPTRPGKFTPKENIHIVVDENLQPIDIFRKDKTRLGDFASKRYSI